MPACTGYGYAAIIAVNLSKLIIVCDEANGQPCVEAGGLRAHVSDIFIRLQFWEQMLGIVKELFPHITVLLSCLTRFELGGFNLGSHSLQ